jgi:hypothetical protein
LRLISFVNIFYKIKYEMFNENNILNFLVSDLSKFLGGMFSFGDQSTDIRWFSDFDVLLSNDAKPKINFIKWKDFSLFFFLRIRRKHEFGLRKKEKKSQQEGLPSIDRWVRGRRSFIVNHSERHCIQRFDFKPHIYPSPPLFLIL